MAADIKRTVETCAVCNERRPANCKEPMIPHEVPSRPWQKVAVDLFSWNNRDYLVTVDFYSRYFEVDELTTTTTAAVVRKLSAHFARHGIPETIVSDNGPQFSSEEFARFTKDWDTKHVTSSPRYPQSNGLAEKTVQTVKNILDKAKAGKGLALLSILEYRNTPVDGLASPAQLLMGRQLRSVLPTTHLQLQPRVVDPQRVTDRRRQCQASQKRFYDRGSRPLPTLQTGEDVFVQLAPGDRWKPARVIAQGRTPRSYQIKLTDGSIYWRNRRFLRRQPRQRSSTFPPVLVAVPEPPVPAQAVAPAANEAMVQPARPDPYVTNHGRQVHHPHRLTYLPGFVQDT